jgi:hypothetical protein
MKKWYVYKDWDAQCFYAWVEDAEIHPFRDVERIGRPLAERSAKRESDRLNLHCGRLHALYYPRHKRKANA